MIKNILESKEGRYFLGTISIISLFVVSIVWISSNTDEKPKKLNKFYQVFNKIQEEKREFEVESALAYQGDWYSNIDGTVYCLDNEGNFNNTQLDIKGTYYLTSGALILEEKEAANQIYKLLTFHDETYLFNEEKNEYLAISKKNLDDINENQMRIEREINQSLSQKWTDILTQGDWQYEHSNNKQSSVQFTDNTIIQTVVNKGKKSSKTYSYIIHKATYFENICLLNLSVETDKYEHVNYDLTLTSTENDYYLISNNNLLIFHESYSVKKDSIKLQQI